MATTITGPVSKNAGPPSQKFPFRTHHTGEQRVQRAARRDYADEG